MSIEINDTNRAARAALAAVLVDLGGRPLTQLVRHSEAAELAEVAGLIDWTPALGSPTAADPIPLDAWAWQITAEEIVILGAACEGSVLLAKDLIDETAEAVRIHGHGQATDDEREAATEAGRLDHHEAPIVVAPGPGPRVELTSPHLYR